MKTLFEPRKVYKPFEYPQYVKYFDTAKNSVWRPESVDMSLDLNDYNTRSTETERKIIREILKTFTIMETHIGDYWADRVCAMFPKHEIVAAARFHSAFEALHATAYDWLNASLGIEDYDAFLGDPQALRKIGNYINCPNDLISLAVFSACGEGVSLFSSFSVLLSLSRSGRYKGLQQIISWSALDEAQHSDMGCELFRDAIAELHDGAVPRDLAEQIREAMQITLDNEFDVIDTLFSYGNLDNINSRDLKAYIRYRAANRLDALGVTHDMVVPKNYKNVKSWFDVMVFGQSDNDFFANAVDGGNYTALLSQDYKTYDFSKTEVKNWGIV